MQPDKVDRDDAVRWFYHSFKMALESGGETTDTYSIILDPTDAGLSNVSFGVLQSILPTMNVSELLTSRR